MHFADQHRELERLENVRFEAEGE
jgi:hypothetical protein